MPEGAAYCNRRRATGAYQGRTRTAALLKTRLKRRVLLGNVAEKDILLAILLKCTLRLANRPANNHAQLRVRVRCWWGCRC
jgi:hypothetical protein